ncbi:hypothetical protein VIBNIFTn2_1240011 [Vibrio nigripulchritudo FTn2]|nr:hypothetical protein VIBNIFTn2_1240011 [Vibrio nigripulchritudo FTn2]
MLCVNPENGVLAVKALSSDGTCPFTALYTAQELTQGIDRISNTDITLLLGAVVALYSTVFVIKSIQQHLGYRH